MEMDIHQEPIQNNNNDTTAVAQQGMYIDIPVNIEIEDTKLQQQPQDLGTVEEPPVEPFTVYFIYEYSLKISLILE